MKERKFDRVIDLMCMMIGYLYYWGRFLLSSWGEEERTMKRNAWGFVS